MGMKFGERQRVTGYRAALRDMRQWVTETRKGEDQRDILALLDEIEAHIDILWVSLRGHREG